MVVTRLGTMRIVACAHPALLAKYGEPQRPRDLAALPIIRIESPMPYRGWRFRAAEREDQLINLPPVLSVTTPESAADAARLGVGWPAYCIIRRWMACATGAPSAAGKRRAGSGAGPFAVYRSGSGAA